jgi:hypothetical protein
MPDIFTPTCPVQRRRQKGLPARRVMGGLILPVLTPAAGMRIGRGYYMATPNGYAENLRSRTFSAGHG